MSLLKELRADNPKYVALDTETEGLNFDDKAFALTCAWIHGQEVKSYYLDLSEDSELACDLVAAVHTAVFHNAKFDLQKLRLSGILQDRMEFEDTEGLAHLLDEHRPKRLKYLTRELLQIDTTEEEELRKVCRKLKIKKADGYKDVPREILEPYAVKDAEYTIQLFRYFLPQIQAHKDLFQLYQHEKELTWALLDIEEAGLGVDRAYTSETLKVYNSNVVKLQLRCCDLAENEEFNPNSNPQVRAYFEAKGVVREKYDKQTLLAVVDPMAETLLALRKTSKMAKTYLEAMLSESVLQRGQEELFYILHPHYRQYLPVTGRMSSGKVEA